MSNTKRTRTRSRTRTRTRTRRKIKTPEFREKETYLWSDVASRTSTLFCPTAHYAAVDSVHVMDRYAVHWHVVEILCTCTWY